EDVKKKLTSEAPEISIIVTKSRHGGERPTRAALKHKEVPTASIDSTAAQEPIREAVRMIPTFHPNTEDTIGKGGRIQVLQTIGQDFSGKEEQWVELEHAN